MLMIGGSRPVKDKTDNQEPGSKQRLFQNWILVFDFWGLCSRLTSPKHINKHYRSEHLQSALCRLDE